MHRINSDLLPTLVFLPRIEVSSFALRNKIGMSWKEFRSSARSAPISDHAMIHEHTSSNFYHLANDTMLPDYRLLNAGLLFDSS